VQRPPVDEILRIMPELGPYGRAAARIDVEPGAPGIRDSSIGGPLLWPRNEPWPACSVPDELEPEGFPAVALVPVAQIFARDVPGPWWPDGLDLLQILWCPNGHEDPPANQAPESPVVELRWRRSGDVREVPATPPEPVRRDEDFYVLTPCTITTEPIVDFPFREELPERLRPRLRELVEQTSPGGGDVITRVSGWKVGGWPTWHLTGVNSFACGICGRTLVLLFTIASDDTVGTTVGRCGELRLFVCPEHHHEFRADLH
jgi:hypothetical protein